MGWFSDDSDQAQAYDQVVNAPHKAELSHELIAAAASYEAAKAYEKHVAENGPPDNHAKAKELLAGFTGFFVDRLVESKGVSIAMVTTPTANACFKLDCLDTAKAKHHAKQQAEVALGDQGYF